MAISTFLPLGTCPYSESDGWSDFDICDHRYSEKSKFSRWNEVYKKIVFITIYKVSSEKRLLFQACSNSCPWVRNMVDVKAKRYEQGIQKLSTNVIMSVVIVTQILVQLESLQLASHDLAWVISILLDMAYLKVFLRYSSLLLLWCWVHPELV